ncbi:MAG: EVE domain-containing protein [Patescibacteria group bacterium]
MQHWLLKTEPSTYSWDDLVREGTTSWTGVRNFQARNNLRAMRIGDSVFIYHSVNERSIHGLAIVARAAYPDPTAREGDWVAVDIRADRAADVPLSLDDIKKLPELKNMVLVKNSRLSVQPVAESEWSECLTKIYPTSL